MKVSQSEWRTFRPTAIRICQYSTLKRKRLVAGRSSERHPRQLFRRSSSPSARACQSLSSTRRSCRETIGFSCSAERTVSGLVDGSCLSRRARIRGSVSFVGDRKREAIVRDYFQPTDPNRQSQGQSKYPRSNQDLTGRAHTPSESVPNVPSPGPTNSAPSNPLRSTLYAPPSTAERSDAISTSLPNTSCSNGAALRSASQSSTAG